MYLFALKCLHRGYSPSFQKRADRYASERSAKHGASSSRVL